MEISREGIWFAFGCPQLVCLVGLWTMVFVVWRMIEPWPKSRTTTFRERTALYLWIALLGVTILLSWLSLPFILRLLPYL